MAHNYTFLSENKEGGEKESPKSATEDRNFLKLG
jgi:hypothetical protein